MRSFKWSGRCIPARALRLAVSPRGYIGAHVRHRRPAIAAHVRCKARVVRGAFL
jgi:hypothetical protein